MVNNDFKDSHIVLSHIVVIALMINKTYEVRVHISAITHYCLLVIYISYRENYHLSLKINC